MSTNPDPSGYATLTSEQKAEVDAISTAVWSVPDVEGILEARVRQLKEIEERLERIGRLLPVHSTGIREEVRSLVLDLQHMIQTAEHEAARF